MKPFLKRCTIRQGFALVVTLLLLVLITVMALGLLSLSSTSLRTGETAMARSKAQANARMALSLAIAQLQLHTGPDQRISALAEFLADADHPQDFPNPGWTGVWQAEPEQFERAREDRFLQWLVTSTEAAGHITSASEDSSTWSEGTAVRIRKQSHATARDVWVPLLQTPDQGRLGWWTEDESVKARTNLPLTNPSTIGEKLLARHAAPRPAPEGLKPEIEGFEPNRDAAVKMVTPGQSPLAATRWPEGSDKDFTTYSRSLVIDVKNGGFKRDLSTLFELPKDTIMAIGEFGTWRGLDSYVSAKSYLYGQPGIPLGARWNMLYEYYNLYKDIALHGSEAMIVVPADIQPYDDNSPNQTSPTAFGDKTGGFRFPRITNMSYVFSYDTIKEPQPPSGDGTPPDEEKDNRLRLHATAFVTLWNPFDTRIVFPEGIAPRLSAHSRAPFQMTVLLNGNAVLSEELSMFLSGDSHFFDTGFHAPGPGSSQFSIGPGETISFCYKPASSPGPGAGMFVRCSPNEDLNAVKETRKLNVWGSDDDQVQVRITPREYQIAAGTHNNFNHHLEMQVTSLSDPDRHDYRGQPKALSGTNFISVLEPAASPTESFAKLRTRVAMNGNIPVPIMGFRMSMKTATELESAGDFVPAMLYAAQESLHSVVFGDPSEALSAKYEYSSRSFAGTGNLDDFVQNNGGYGLIGSGNSTSSGQSHFIAVALPKVPPTSLAQLRHAGTGTGANLVKGNLWGQGARQNWWYFGPQHQGEFHTVVPFASNAIGNSYGHPLISPNRDEEPTAPDIQGGAYQMDDHSYKANEVLWDSYFFSSLAPRTADRFGSSKSMVSSWKEFLEGSSTLLNPRFSPSLNRHSLSHTRSRIFSGVSDDTLNPDAYRKIAPHLILEGGFNVNSTSVDAWRAILSSTRRQVLAKLTKGASSSGETVGNGAVYSRTDVILTGSVDSPGADIDTHYNGFRDLDEEDIGKLATEIVREIRLRGPFLNLGQFINRRLSTDPALALSGPMQSAIDRAGLNQSVHDAGRSTSGHPGGVTMKFPQAAELGSAAGSPGWLMQGDLLDPLGPSLVARGDTFRIRAYGDARSADGKILARARCEAVVQRVAEFLDPSEPADAEGGPSHPVNRTFGRRYEMVQFRWLPDTED
jgi:hypothetical protein